LGHVQRQAGGYQLRIRDTGLALRKPSRQVFEEFYQVGNASRNRQGGLGLGLSIVKRLADLLELELGMQSHPGKGTVFTLALVGRWARHPGSARQRAGSMAITACASAGRRR
jgi:signal transduction histidine kinase